MHGRFENVEWDERKSARNVSLRGFGFDFAARLFLEDYVERENRGRDFEEQRFVAIGSVGGLILTVIWTPRGANKRIISARPASKKERNIYHGHRQKEIL
jgi:uncharacterized DUF497 family protein